MLSDGDTSTSGGSKVVDESYHLSLDSKYPKKQWVTFVPIWSRRSDSANLPKELKDSDTKWDDAFDDTYLANFETVGEDADLETGITHLRLAIDAPR